MLLVCSRIIPETTLCSMRFFSNKLDIDLLSSCEVSIHLSDLGVAQFIGREFKRIISLASELGLKLTPAGSTHPYGVDPEDQYLRIAPTACSIEELDSAMEILVCCLGLANQDN